MLKKFLYLTTFLIAIAGSAFSKNIVIVLPIEHEALTEIVNGFKSELQKKMGNVPLNFQIKNALGDINIQRTIFLQAEDQKPDLLVPVGTSTAQMAASMIKDIPIVATASLPIETSNVTGVNDQIPVDKSFQLMAQIKPKMKEIAVLYSPHEKNFRQLKRLEKIAGQKKVDVHAILIPNLTELYSNVKSVPKSSDFMFIFKDNLVASGITVLVNEAQLDKIPLMTSDEGTVSKGACFALGVYARQIGDRAADLAYKILAEDKKPVTLPFEHMKTLSVFRNIEGCKTEAIDPALIAKSAETLGYKIVDLN